MDEFEGTYAPQSPDLSGYHSFDQSNTYNQTYSHPTQHSNSYQDTYPATQGQSAFDHYPADTLPHTTYPPQEGQAVKSRKAKAQVDEDDYASSSVQSKQARQTKKQKVEEDVCEIPAPGASEGVEVKTKFPVARIKRIMQADEDVGKVSQVTPTAVSKALELFIISLTLKSTSVARAKSSKRVTAAHLKQAVVGDEQLDFLEGIVSKVSDAPAGSKADGKKKENVTEDESSDEAFGSEKAKKKGVGTKKRRA